MGDTSIEWTKGDDGTSGKTWNPVRGCSRVSAGCEHCYAERVAARFSGPGQPYEGLARMDEGQARWSREVRLVPEHLADPLRWKRPRRVFVNSMSDVFHEKLTNEEIAAVFGVMAATPRHTFQVLTKRPERMRDWFRWASRYGQSIHATTVLREQATLFIGATRPRASFGRDVDLDAMLRSDAVWPLPHVWLGVSVEDQHRADERIPLLLATPAAVRFVSAEPLLEGVDLSRWLDWRTHRKCEHCSAIGPDGEVCPHCRKVGLAFPALDWVICGAESGSGARPMKLDWARWLREQCAGAGVPFFLKQFADEHGRKVSLPILDGRQHVAWPGNRR